MSSRRGWGEDGIFFEHDALCRDSERHRHCEAKAADGSGHGRPPCGLGVCTDSSDRKQGAPGQARAEAGC